MHQADRQLATRFRASTGVQRELLSLPHRPALRGESQTSSRLPPVWLEVPTHSQALAGRHAVVVDPAVA
jgi:hypothetical protein